MRKTPAEIGFTGGEVVRDKHGKAGRDAGCGKAKPDIEETVLPYLVPELKNHLDSLPRTVWERLEEIRLRKGRPLILRLDRGALWLDRSGRCLERPDRGNPLIVGDRMVDGTLERLSRGSLYALEEEFKQGFITVEGGHRVGIAGRTLLREGKVYGMKHVSSLNFRICREIPGAADELLPLLLSPSGEVYNTLIVSPPRCGKTTIIRDVARQLSDGPAEGTWCFTVGVVDERSELGGAWKGIPQNDLGSRTDLLDGCPKAEGIMMLIRSMSPEVIVTDELGTKREFGALLEAQNAGVKVISTLHAQDCAQANTRLKIAGENRAIFDRLVVLSRRCGPGTIERIYDTHEGKFLAPENASTGR